MIRKSIFSVVVLSFSLCYVQAQTQWKKVSETLVFEQPPFKNCHASTIVQTQKGDLLLACFGGSQEGKNDVVIWNGKIEADGKVNPKAIADGKAANAEQYPCWNPVFLRQKNNRLVLFYKVGPNPREWWGMYKTSDDNGLTWSAPTRLPNGILGPIKNKPVILSNGNILCPSSIELPNGHWKVQIEVADRNLKKWKAIPVDTGSAFDVIQPSILFHGKDRLQILCRSKQGTVVQSWSEDNGKTWSPLSKTTLLNPNSGTDAVTLTDGSFLIVYNPDVPGKDWFNGRAKLRVAASKDGKAWEDVVILENGTKEEFSYPAIIQTADGLVHITYTYDRKNIKHVVIEPSKK